MRIVVTLMICLSFCLTLAGCGKKPKFVDAPKYDANGNYLGYAQLYGPDGLPDYPGHEDGTKPAKQQDTFPKTYPKPWL